MLKPRDSPRKHGDGRGPQVLTPRQVAEAAREELRAVLLADARNRLQLFVDTKDRLQLSKPRRPARLLAAAPNGIHTQRPREEAFFLQRHSPRKMPALGRPSQALLHASFTGAAARIAAAGHELTGDVSVLPPLGLSSSPRRQRVPGPEGTAAPAIGSSPSTATSSNSSSSSAEVGSLLDVTWILFPPAAPPPTERAGPVDAKLLHSLSRIKYIHI